MFCLLNLPPPLPLVVASLEVFVRVRVSQCHSSPQGSEQDMSEQGPEGGPTVHIWVLDAVHR